MGSQDLPDIPRMKVLLVLSVFLAQAFSQTAECEPPLPSECAEGDISCDMGTHADCWLGDVCMPEGSVCPPSCNTPAPSECQAGEVMCDMGTSPDGCWLGDYCMAEGSVCPSSSQTPAPSGGEAVVPGTESPLANLNINPDTIAISGFSSGAAFSTQFHVAFSERISGVGVFAGLPSLATSGLSEADKSDEVDGLA